MFVLTSRCPSRTPKPQVTWRKGLSSEPLRGRPGLAVLDEGSLFLASVSPSDGGDYASARPPTRRPVQELSWWSMVSRDPRAGGDGTLGALPEDTVPCFSCPSCLSGRA